MADRGRGRGRGSGRGRGQARGRGKHDESPLQRDSSCTNGEMNAHLTERFRGRPRRDRNREAGYDGSMPNTKFNPEIAKYVLAQDQICADANHDDWLAMPEIPPASEITLPEGASIALPRNKIDKPWAKPGQYLRSHYRLLREDAVAPLREAVGRFRKDPQRMDDNETRIYEQVRVVGLTFTYKGIASRIRFSTVRSGRKISWAASKRLTSGTLVALTPTSDEFKTTCIPAIVAARPLQNLECEVPEVDILFGDLDHHEVDAQNTYIMVEATQGYYEAYRHTLRALQKQSQETFPLAEHICHLHPQVDAPDYLKQMPDRDISPAADEHTRDAFQSVNILDNWPAKPSASLDHTQWLAMQDILTKKLAIIQGPPGTGKTHVSKIAINILLRNRVLDDPPIIVACQTNHALDQLLMFVKEFESNFIRLGGRATLPEIKQRALHLVRQGESMDDIQGSCFNKARRDIAIETMKLKRILSPVREDEGAKPSPMTAEMLFSLGVINEPQCKSLEKGASQWVRSHATVTDDPLQIWLGRSVTNFEPKYAQQNFGFEEAEEDLEAEQLKEYEAEMGIADEEDTEMLKGDFLSLSMGYTMPKPTIQVLDQAKRLLDTATDLYRIQDYLRGPIYLVMQERAKRIVKARLRENARTYAKIATQIQIGRWEKDIAYLSKAPIVGMTTTGLSKYRALVSALKPKIVLIEEAAEVLEAPVGVACVESLQHLVLVGDHMQLQANCSVKELEGEPYFLNISMFERLVRNKIPHKTLLRQRRMDPAFRELIALTYPELDDHESVTTRPRVRFGMGPQITWFFKHDAHELQDESMSTFNEFEAQMVAKFYRHLIRNRVPAAGITVLTFYNGQRKKILRYLKDDHETASVYNKVKTVDSYQGEENRIIILSLVRSNTSNKIGFLNINNRIVVALSRAQYGFYLFGNGDFLAEHNELWDYVEALMHKKGSSDTQMPLACTNHNKTVWVRHPEQFDDLDGGCDLPCGGQLVCGHPCPLKCHPKPHEWINCHRRCSKELVCGHFCQKQCAEDCSCDCDNYRRHQEELSGGPVPDGIPQWTSFAKGSLTEENISKLSEENDRPPSKQLIAGENQIPRPQPEHDAVLKRTSRADGRTRFEEHYRHDATAEPPTEGLNQLHLVSTSTPPPQPDEKGKRRETPERRARSPPALGLDGTDDRFQASSQPNWRFDPAPLISDPNKPSDGDNVATAVEPDLMIWDQEPVEDDNVFDEWLDPETKEWREQQRKEIKNMGTEFW